MVRGLCFGLLLVMAIAAVGCGSGGGGTTAASGPSGSRRAHRERWTQPARRKPRRHHGPHVAGEARPIAGGAGAEAWAQGRAIYLTANGGRTWRSAAPVDVHGFFGSDFVDREHGWVVASTSARNPHLVIYATADGGFTWTRGTVRKSRQLTIVGVPLSFPSLRVGYALVDPLHSSGVEAEGRLYRTEDGGATWTPVGTTPVDGRIEFTSAERGWLAGGLSDSLWHTRDGGRHWTSVRVTRPPGAAHAHLRYGLPIRFAGDLEVLPVLLEGEPTRIAFYERGYRGWKPAYVDTLVGGVGGGLDGAVSERPPDALVVDDPGTHPLKLIEFGPGGTVSTHLLPARGLPAGASVRFADRRHGVATPCSGCEHPGTQPYFTEDGGRTWARRPVLVRRSAALEVLPRCQPAKLLVYHREEGGVGLGSVYTSLTIENLSGHTCKYSGTPRAVALGVGGRTIGREAQRAPNLRPAPGHRYRTVILTPNDTATAKLSYGEAYNYPPETCRPRMTAGLLVTLPGAHRPQRVAMPFEHCSNPHTRGGPGMTVGRIE
jgi:photosystem II stability/assembly factor-like uncharacterized protein